MSAQTAQLDRTDQRKEVTPQRREDNNRVMQKAAEEKLLALRLGGVM